MRKFFLLFLLPTFIVPVFRSSAQTCITSSSSASNIISNEISARSSSSSFCINVYFHIVRNTNGTNAFPEPDTDEIIKELNTYFSPHDIYINKLGKDYINRTEFLTVGVDGNKIDPALFQIQNNPNAINFYIVDDFELDGLAGAAETVLATNLAITNEWAESIVAVHEVGHCLDLWHTHEKQANEVEKKTRRDSEGANCEEAGDELCDTPADPKLREFFNIDSNCNYTKNDGYDPLTNNIMSAAPVYCRDSFTDGQIGRMKDALFDQAVLQNIISNSCAKLTDLEEVCQNKNTDFSISNLNGASINWSVSSKLQIISTGTNNLRVSPKSGYLNQEAWVKAEMSNGIELEDRFTIIKKPNELGTLMGAGSVVSNAWEYYEVAESQFAEDYIWVLPSGWSFHHTADPSSNKVLLVTGTQSGYVAVKATNPCGDTNYKSKYVSVSTSDPCGSPVCFQMFPNPAQQTLSIEVNEKENGKLNDKNKSKTKVNSKYTLYNKFNKVVANGEFTQSTTINLSNIRKGAYTVKVQHQGLTETKQLIIN
ncbi:T9SS type A sorting domain-containing protein [Marivirga sp.]|uniref:T9SS type A sorting domain-containing protein n=1 Tax=Marivirga sp. TaxID=2018662 RepID=UPI003DA7A0CE